MGVQLQVDERVEVNGDVVAREVEGETVLLHLRTGMYFGLDAIGTAVWRALVEHGRADAALTALLEQYDVSRDALARDVQRLLDELLARDLIRRRT
jgi:hypothetical protein